MDSDTPYVQQNQENNKETANYTSATDGSSTLAIFLAAFSVRFLRFRASAERSSSVAAYRIFREISSNAFSNSSKR